MPRIGFRLLINVDRSSSHADVLSSELYTTPADNVDEFADKLDTVITDILDRHCPLPERRKQVSTRRDNRWLSKDHVDAKGKDVNSRDVGSPRAMLTATSLTGSRIGSQTSASSRHAATTGYGQPPMIHVDVDKKFGTSCTSPLTARSDLTMIALSCRSASQRSSSK